MSLFPQIQIHPTTHLLSYPIRVLVLFLS
ncbi:hypothetical protein NC653_031942 [Populus alba x Populus x berolinensis]|uniref:Uncharacterized protein n=1 Tax=Populus alba x Populus x berolinensis TaxID=444605 RepID=A0AAD6Q264_9ROSI|nr:hypothetical protein NC653_031942 [Populus alba x Populus x berolinensis]